VNQFGSIKARIDRQPGGRCSVARSESASAPRRAERSARLIIRRRFQVQLARTNRQPEDAHDTDCLFPSNGCPVRRCGPEPNYWFPLRRAARSDAESPLIWSRKTSLPFSSSQSSREIVSFRLLQAHAEASVQAGETALLFPVIGGGRGGVGLGGGRGGGGGWDGLWNSDIGVSGPRGRVVGC